MDKVSIVSPIKRLNEYLTEHDLRAFKKISTKYLSIGKDIVSFEIELSEDRQYGVLKMSNSERSVVLRILVIPYTGVCTATPIQIGDGLNRVVLNDFALLSSNEFNLVVT